jgi:predicted enzyme related to lactoylglutathione lyase
LTPPVEPKKEETMPRLRHFAIVVSDLEKSANFYESVFDLKRVGQETLDFAAAIYLSDGVINLALLNYFGKRGSGLDDAKKFIGAHHFGFQVEDIGLTQKRIEEAGGTFFFDLGEDQEKENFERKFKDPDGIIFDISKRGWLGATG